MVDSYCLGVNSYLQKPVDFEQFRRMAKDLGMYWIIANRHAFPICNSREGRNRRSGLDSHLGERPACPVAALPTHIIHAFPGPPFSSC